MDSQRDVGVILVAGGIGLRMGSALPKQYLPLQGIPIAQHSLTFFAQLKQTAQIVIVCKEPYREYFHLEGPVEYTFASPGARRQDSVYNGLRALKSHVRFVCVHDAVRPCIDSELVERVIVEAREHGAAVAGVPMKCTVKQVKADGFVEKTLDRVLLWEVQTPQIVERALFEKGFSHVLQAGITVTDDVSIVESIGGQVKMVMGSYDNIKVTTREDLLLCEQIMSKRVRHG